MLLALRRWFARRPALWASSVALGLALTLGHAGLMATGHALLHDSHGRAAHPSSIPLQAASSQEAWALHADVCSLCLVAAALAGAAPAVPQTLLTRLGKAVAAAEAAHAGFTPRFVRLYASRAPPAQTRPLA